MHERNWDFPHTSPVICRAPAFAISSVGGSSVVMIIFALQPEPKAIFGDTQVSVETAVGHRIGDGVGVGLKTDPESVEH